MVFINSSMKKGRISFFALVTAIFLLWLLIFTVVIGLNPDSFGIGTKKEELERGESLNLSYEVRTWRLNGIENISVNAGISGYPETYRAENISRLEMLEVGKGVHNIDISRLSEGRHKVLANLSYMTHSGKEINKSLSLKFNVTQF